MMIIRHISIHRCYNIMRGMINIIYIIIVNVIKFFFQVCFIKSLMKRLSVTENYDFVDAAE